MHIIPSQLAILLSSFASFQWVICSHVQSCASSQKVRTKLLKICGLHYLYVDTKSMVLCNVVIMTGGNRI